MLRKAGPPLEVGNERGAELWVIRELSVVGGETHQRREAEPLLGRDREVVMLGEHPLVAAELVGVARRTSEDLTPPGDHVQSVLLGHSARKQRRDQLVGFDSVVEGVDQA